MPGYVLFSLLAAFFYSLAGISGKFAAKHKISNIYSLLFWLNLTALVFLPFLWWKAGVVANPLIAAKPLLIWGLTVCPAIYLMWKLLYRLDISFVQPLFNAQSIFVTFFAFFMLDERFFPAIYASIALIILGSVLISYEENFRPRSFLKKDTLLMFGVLVLFALSDIYVKKALQAGLDMWNFKAWSTVITALVFSFCYFPAKESIKISFGQIRPLLANNLFILLAHLSVLVAFQSNVTISQALAMFGSLFTLVIVAALARKYPQLLESHSGKVYAVRALGSAIMIGAVALILANS